VAADSRERRGFGRCSSADTATRWVPLASCASVGGIPVAQLLSPSDSPGFIERTRKRAGAEIVAVEDGQRYYAPAAATAEMSRPRPATKASAAGRGVCDKEYGVGGYYVGCR